VIFAIIVVFSSRDPVENRELIAPALCFEGLPVALPGNIAHGGWTFMDQGSNFLKFDFCGPFE
jgi:hypothetical protein